MRKYLYTTLLLALLVRRNGRLYVINKKNPKYKQRQG